MTPDEARRLVRVIDLYEGELEEFIKGVGADRIGIRAALNPELAKVAFEVDRIRRKIAGNGENMARMIAGMHTEYAIEHQHTPGGQWHQVTGWSHEPPLNDGHTLAPDERIIRRYVTTPEEV